jgi:mannose-6-phosphate isomerase
LNGEAILYPLKFAPVYKEKIWGGRKLETVFRRQLPSGMIGESWDVTAHPHGMSVVTNGPSAGKTLQELWSSHREAFSLYDKDDRFPLLVKLIDANEDLSVQVHPGDEYAAVHENGTLGKTEMWYVIAADEGGFIVYGVKPEVTKESFIQALQKEAIEGCLNKVYVKPGEVYEIPAGLLHALGVGVLVAEVQQNSDTTYRVYDWGRVDVSGNPRETHIKKALDVIDFSLGLKPSGADDEYLVSNRYFKVKRIMPEGFMEIPLDGRFHILTNLEREIQVKANDVQVELAPGESCLVPAGCMKYEIIGHGSLLQSQTN